jgi:hypothetical protein
LAERAFASRFGVDETGLLDQRKGSRDQLLWDGGILASLAMLQKHLTTLGLLISLLKVQQHVEKVPDEYS